jgi:hypothetical protein
MLEMGHWLQRKWANVCNLETEATLMLHGLGVPLDVLEHEWKAQLDAQLASLPHIDPHYYDITCLLTQNIGQNWNIVDCAIAKGQKKKKLLTVLKGNLNKANSALE